MSELDLLDAAFLFRFEFPLLQHDLKWGKRGLSLPPECRIPRFSSLTHESQPVGPEFADVRMAWNKEGLGFWMRVDGKRQLPWCRDTRTGESDGMRLFVDTRNSQKLHRANRYCHYFAFSPIGGGTRRDQPFAAWLPIDQARETNPPVAPELLRVSGQLDSSGYQLCGLIPASALHGFDPDESPSLGLTYWVTDHELGQQMMFLRGTFPANIDPSLWGTARLVRSAK